MTSIFLLSPANCGGKRAAMLLRPEAEFELATRLRGPAGAPLGEVFAFVSGLYFRGKLAYAGAFGRPPDGMAGGLVITAGRGLLPVGVPIGPAEVRGFASIPVDPRDARYREPLRDDLSELARRLPATARVVLLGSVATTKYLDPLLEAFGRRLCYPAAFVGMGDMQRGALMLRAAREGVELDYVEAEGAARSSARRVARPR
jgi:hypothetical protein